MNSRPQKRLNRTWRRRECTVCHAVFTTEEAVDLSGSIVVRPRVAGGSAPQPFSRDKLFASLLRALGHRKTAVMDASALTDTVVAALLRSTTSAVVFPQEIVMVAQETLARFDHAAGVHYQAYHTTE